MIRKNLISGFSLIELMIVIAIIMTLASLIGINNRFFNKSRTITELNLLHAACCYLQQSAIARNSIQELVFDFSNNSYSLQGQTHILAPCVRFGVIPLVKGPPSSPASAILEPITFANQTITFYPDGIISAGTVYITDSHALYALSSAVAHASHLRKYRYDGAWHSI